MALINNIYVFVSDESLKRDNDIAQHPVEKGLPLTDTVSVNPKTLSISGKIVDAGNLTAEEIISKLENLRTNGSLVNYSGRNIANGFQIKSFNTSHPNTNWGGADFDMELVEVRIAKSSYNSKSQQKTATVQKEKNTTNPTISVGSIVVFKGGPVYVSSDAKKAAATRSRSTCRVTIISKYSYSVHNYHLVSTDGKMVYGWVDKINIEGTGTTGTAGTTNAGTQQVKNK